MAVLEQIRAIWSRLPGPQRIFIASVGVALMAIIILVGVWASREEYGVLYANLNTEDAAAIVEELRSRKVPYRLEADGSTVLVPRNRVYETRLSLASAGLPEASGYGYELLDANKMGWTDFVQKVQFRRALEGEIARTIQTLDEIKQARVHIVIPEPSLFKESEKPTTASVVVRLRAGAHLTEGKIQGITHLVAAAVEGLSAENVTILDTSGRLLSKPGDGGLLGSTSEQIELVRTVEEHLMEKAQSALEAVLGPQKAVVRVAVELDFERVERTREIFDSENPVVRSEQRQEESQADGGTKESSTTNYEVSSTVERIVAAPGAIKRLTASVFVDGTYTLNDKGEREYVPRSQEEMQKLRNLIANAIGFDPQRGDELTVENIAFDDTQKQKTLKEMEEQQRLLMIEHVGGVAGYVLLAVGALLVLWRIVQKLKIETVAAEAQAAGEEVDEVEIPETFLKSKDIRTLRIERKLEEISKQPPEQIARVIRAWLREK